jgi:hypothetical protein
MTDQRLLPQATSALAEPANAPPGVAWPAAGPDHVRADSGERRRPGRVAQVNPHLVALLRDPAMAEIARLEAALAATSQDQLRVAKGLAAGLGLALPLWGALALAARWLLNN